jgi:cysteine desulfurase
VTAVGSAGRHYLDHASTSPARPEVVEAMLPWLTGPGAADPARVHTEGHLARRAVEDARDKVAALLGVRSRQVVFTSGATEAANAAVWGAVRARPGGAVVCPAVEHSSVRDSSSRLALVVEVGVDRLGRVDPDAFDDALAAATARADGGVALAHCQWANHEVGTTQPVEEVVERCRRRGALVHVDAAAAVGHVPVDLGALGADLASVSAHKLGGPKGVGCLVVGRGVRLEPLLVGGQQERARRAGMENTAAIVGFGAAAELLAEPARLASEEERARRQSRRALDGALGTGGVAAYGDTVRRLPHIVCVGVEGVEAEAVVLGLDQAGIAVHSGSACSSESLEPSPVLLAMGVDAERSLRVSVGWSTTDEDVEAFVAALPAVAGSLRALRAGSPAPDQPKD